MGEKVVVGAGAVVIMGSVVLKSVPAGSMIQGNPAKVLFLQQN